MWTWAVAVIFFLTGCGFYAERCEVREEAGSRVPVGEFISGDHPFTEVGDEDEDRYF